MEYKGYIAEVEFDSSVGLLHGSVINSGPYPIANCQAADIETLWAEFRISVDEYLASCEEDGVEARKPSSKETYSLAYAAPSCQALPAATTGRSC